MTIQEKRRKKEKYNFIIIYCWSFFVIIFSFLTISCDINKENEHSNDNYTVAAYVWPSCHDDERATAVFWSEGIGEWENIKKGPRRFDGHYQPRIPLWGYKLDNDPEAWEQKIHAATNHGINAFIFDWYWYDGKPFLESAINNGFLGARNNKDMKFYLMWANHDVPLRMWNHHRYYSSDSVIWTGCVDMDNFIIIVDRLINKYFKLPTYYKIKGEPVFSIYDPTNLARGFNGIIATKEALDFFRKEVKKAGFPGLHIQLVGRGRADVSEPYLVIPKESEGYSVNEIISQWGVNSVTVYNWMPAGMNEDYIQVAENNIYMQNKWDSLLNIPYFPNVTMGRDASPRHPSEYELTVIHYNNSPESFGAYLQKAKDYLKSHPEQSKLITIYAWNEWVEGSYLEPDMKWGYSYLEAVKKVMDGKYDKY